MQGKLMRSYGEFPNNSLCEQLASSGGSRISHRGRVDPLGGVDLQRRCFLVKMCAKTKELDPIGGHAPGMPP